MEGFELYVPILIQAAEQLLDKLVPGERLTELARKIVRSAYFESKNWAAEAAANSKTTVDDAVLLSFWRQCEDAAEEGGFELPVFEVAF